MGRRDRDMVPLGTSPLKLRTAVGRDITEGPTRRLVIENYQTTWEETKRRRKEQRKTTKTQQKKQRFEGRLDYTRRKPLTNLRASAERAGNCWNSLWDWRSELSEKKSDGPNK